VDESVFYIQSDYAGDPRQFYYGTKRGQQLQTQSTLNQKSYAKLVLGEKDELMEEQQKISRDRRQAGFDEYDKDASGTLQDGETRLEKSKREFVTGGVSGGRFDARNSAMPASASVSTGLAAFKSSEAKVAAEMPMQPPGGEEPAVQVRTDFRSTILWQPDVMTDKSGQATVKVKYPDSLTGWKATARAATTGNQFGIADATTRTKQPLMVRLQAPRFFVVGDFVVISAVANNNTDQSMKVQLSLDAVGVEVTGLFENGQPVKGELGPREVPANGEVRQDWYVHVSKAGPVKLKVTGRGGKYSDAMEKSYTAYEHGIEKFLSKSGKTRGNDITVKLELPARKPESTMLTVQLTPSMAVTMLDALPYLIDYPYGCTEQTMSRFLPAVITAKTLRDLGLQPEDVMSRVFGGIETNSATATHPKGKKDLVELDAMTKAGLERLYDFQHSDGGWGWWKQGESDHWMTAYVVWGLSLARHAGVDLDGHGGIRKQTVGTQSNGVSRAAQTVDPTTGLPIAGVSSGGLTSDALNRAVRYLDQSLIEEENNYDMQAWMLHALSAARADSGRSSVTAFESKALENLWQNRENLNAYTRALFALALHYIGDTEKAKVLIANFENGVKRDDRPDTSVLIGGTVPTNAGVIGTAHWGEDGVYWRWSDGGVEATAFALRALLAIDPQNKLIEPVTNWLIKNRRGAQWSNTRDTAIVVLAMNDYLRVSGELKGDLEYELIVNGKSIATQKVSGADVFNAPSRFTIDPKLVKDSNEIRIKRTRGSGPIYFAVEGKFFSLEEPITAAGNEIFVKREYFKLVGRPTLLKGYAYDKEPLRDGESVRSGERVETLITIEGKNNYEYLLFEDLKPAGFEAVEVRSGESLYARELKSGAVERKFVAGKPVIEEPDFTGRQRWVYQELRDRKVALFLDKLPEGVWEIRYDLRAEVPGIFHALPTLGHAMYVPDIRCNGAEVKVKVEEAQP